MKRLLTLVLLSLIYLGSYGQSNTEQEMIRSYFKVAKTAIFEESMGLSNEESEIFWPLYKAYDVEATELNNMRIDYLTDYVNNFENITDEQVDAILKSAARYNKKMAALKTKYYRQMKKQLSAGVAMRFIQIEEYIQTVVKYEILEALPFVGDEF
jgi:hypothetical protein